MADSTSNGGDAVAPQDLNLRIRAPGSSMHSTPSGFWPPLQNSNSFKRTDVSCNPLLLGATTSAPVVPAEPQREVHFHMDSILEDASMNSGLEVEALEGKAGAAGGAVPVSVHSMGVNPQLRQRSRKIMSTRRITSPITRHSDVVWQENPSRILKYRASTLHLYGWVPFLIWRNVKATVFGNFRLYLQTILLVAWMAVVHLTGCGAPKQDIQAFVKIFSTQYMGAVFNVGTVVVFILGLFVTLVINRWWAMRGVYAKLASHTVDCATVMSSVIRHPENRDDPRVKRARTELIRFLNLGHLLVLTQADGQSRHFYKSKHSEKLFDNTIGKLKTWMTRTVDEESGTWQKAARDISFLDLNAEGLVNVDEWQHIVDSEKRGMPRYILAYHWAQAMLHELQARGWIYNSSQSLPAMLNKLSTIVDSGAQIFTYINSQLPYPYVHLVSLVVHSYVWILATYLGALLYAGFNEAQGFVQVEGSEASGSTAGEMLNRLAGGAVPPDAVSELLVAPTESINNYVFTVVFAYFFMILANVCFQGLLDMHTLLDNPFGRHCAKFPLRAQITELMNTCRSLIQTGDTTPECFQDVFQSDSAVVQPEKAPQTVSREAAAKSRAAHQRSASVDFASPQGVPVTSNHRNKSTRGSSPLRAKTGSPPRPGVSFNPKEPRLFRKGLSYATSLVARKSSSPKHPEPPMLRTRSLGDSLEAGSAAATEQSSPDRRLTASMEICISDRPSGSAAEPPSIVVPIVDHVPGLPEGVSPFEMVQNVASQVMVSEPSSLVTSPTPKAVHIEPRTEPELIRRLSTGDVTTPH